VSVGLRLPLNISKSSLRIFRSGAKLQSPFPGPRGRPIYRVRASLRCRVQLRLGPQPRERRPSRFTEFDRGRSSQKFGQAIALRSLCTRQKNRYDAVALAAVADAQIDRRTHLLILRQNRWDQRRPRTFQIPPEPFRYPVASDCPKSNVICQPSLDADLRKATSQLLNNY
jgi:hypothetical protein